jgi:ABC-type Zn uptake system ZnuABC Zn-binding protein ZnuA
MMNVNMLKVALVSSIMIMSSLAGCLSDDVVDEIDDIIDPITEPEPILEEPEIYGKVMVSTYHVGELVKAVGGENIHVDYMSQDNIPVHDYEPSPADIVRLAESDLFFYHGLGLEPWVESTLASMNNAPPSFMTHTMQSGETTLDYDSLLVSNLCELMTEGPFETTTLGMMDDHDDHDDMVDMEDHDDHDDDIQTTADHDDHSNEEDDHDGHDGHDGHDEHGHAEAEKEFVNPNSCPADTVIQVFHMEEGEHILEFESEHDEDFNMAVLKMLGGHAHHHDDHDDHDDHSDDEDDHSDDEDDHSDDHGDGMCHNTTTHVNYESTEEECANAGHMWMEDEDHHDDDHGDGMCHNTTTHQNYESTEADCASAGHVWMAHEDHDLPEIHADRVVHTLSFPAEMVCYDMSAHTVNMSLTTESDCQAAGLMWTDADSAPSDNDHGDDDHGDDHSDEEGDHGDHSNEDEHYEMGALVIHIEEEGDYGFALPGHIGFSIVMGESGHDDHDDHGDHSDDEDDHDDHSDDEDDHDEDEGELAADDDEAFEYDPHSWLDPVSFSAQLNLVMMQMALAFPDGADVFSENADTYNLELTQLHLNFEEAFGEQGTCATSGVDKTIVANHNAYSYISVRYGVNILTVHGLDPEGEPSPAEVAEVVEHIKEEDITTLYVEEYTDQTAVQSIVEETGVDIQILYTMEMAPSDSDDDYLSMMNKNIQNMISGIGC